MLCGKCTPQKSRLGFAAFLKCRYVGAPPIRRILPRSTDPATARRSKTGIEHRGSSKLVPSGTAHSYFPREFDPDLHVLTVIARRLIVSPLSQEHRGI